MGSSSAAIAEASAEQGVKMSSNVLKLHANLPLERWSLNKLHTNYIAGLYVAEISKKRPYELDGKQAYQEMKLSLYWSDRSGHAITQNVLVSFVHMEC